MSEINITELIADWLSSAWRGSHVTVKEKSPTQERNAEMNDALLKAGYDAQQRRIEQLENWITEAITRPAMSREMRLQGLEIMEAQAINPVVRQAVERICPSRTREMGREQSIER